ncbi:MAG: glycosyltransferase family 4 protein [Lachnospiraceae bacterium]|nr:glycosyltransferase family 4 protein [Lachnospiraceae bacterium]
MRVFVVGDYRTGTGPSKVTKEYLLRFPENTSRLIFNSKPLRAAEIVIKMLFCSVVMVSGYSKQNILALKWANFLKKPSAYLMHGCVEHENAINECVDEQMNKTERKTMELSTCIFAVSEHFAGWLKTYYPEYSHKIVSAVNGVDTKLLENLDSYTFGRRSRNMVFTIGGGMPRKKIKHICAAIDILNIKAGEMKYKLVVIGDKGKDDDIINSYPFVENLGLVSENIAMGLFREASLFVQNSCFETFGLAPMEALMNGCSILLSKEIGALELFGSVEEGDVIRNWYDEKEIAAKIDKLMEKGNAYRLTEAFDKESASWETRTIELWQKLVKLTENKKEKAGK